MQYSEKEVGDYYKNCINEEQKGRKGSCGWERSCCGDVPEEPADEMHQFLIGHLYFV